VSLAWPEPNKFQELLSIGAGARYKCRMKKIRKIEIKISSSFNVILQ